MKELQTAIQEIRQSRSRFQIEKFVIGQHDTPEMQYYQTVLEASTLVRALEDSELQIEKLEAEIEELLETGKKSDAVEAKIKRKKIEDMELNLVGTRRELEILTDIFNQFPRYTREDIEKAQPDYWKQRLIRVGQLQHLGAASGINWAQLEAIYQADLLPHAKDNITNVEALEDKSQGLMFDSSMTKQKDRVE